MSIGYESVTVLDYPPLPDWPDWRHNFVDLPTFSCEPIGLPDTTRSAVAALELNLVRDSAQTIGPDADLFVVKAAEPFVVYGSHGRRSSVSLRGFFDAFPSHRIYSVWNSTQEPWRVTRIIIERSGPDEYVARTQIGAATPGYDGPFIEGPLMSEREMAGYLLAVKGVDPAQLDRGCPAPFRESSTAALEEFLLDSERKLVARLAALEAPQAQPDTAAGPVGTPVWVTGPQLMAQFDEAPPTRRTTARGGGLLEVLGLSRFGRASRQPAAAAGVRLLRGLEQPDGRPIHHDRGVERPRRGRRILAALGALVLTGAALLAAGTGASPSSPAPQVNRNAPVDVGPTPTVTPRPSTSITAGLLNPIPIGAPVGPHDVQTDMPPHHSHYIAPSSPDARPGPDLINSNPWSVAVYWVGEYRATHLVDAAITEWNVKKLDDRLLLGITADGTLQVFHTNGAALNLREQQELNNVVDQVGRSAFSKAS